MTYSIEIFTENAWGISVVEDIMAVNKPLGDNTRKGAVRKRSQLRTKMAGEEHWTKRSRASGRFMAVKQDERKFKGVRRERPAARRKDD